jgi:hypothetical protein
MKHYATPTSVGVGQTFVTMGLIYLVAMMAGAFLFRVPPPGFTVAPPVPHRRAITAEHAAARPRMITPRHVHVGEAWKTPQFWLLWAVLFLNVSAGIGILEQASPMIQEMFKGGVTASAAAGFVGLLSIFNMAGRFMWSSASDRLGRKITYGVFFTLGPVLYFAIPHTGRIGSVTLFVVCTALILTMYGGGFATIPAYLSDIFGTQFVGAIHGRLLTAWSAAGVAGPLLVNYIREYQRAHGVPGTHAYDFTMYLMAGLLVVGFLSNFSVRPVAERHFMSDAELEAEVARAPRPSTLRARVM